ncbi:unnamed protein product, partial [Ectocarpus sp. 4 AP-2014]
GDHEQKLPLRRLAARFFLCECFCGVNWRNSSSSSNNNGSADMLLPCPTNSSSSVCLCCMESAAGTAGDVCACLAAPLFKCVANTDEIMSCLLCPPPYIKDVANTDGKAPHENIALPGDSLLVAKSCGAPARRNLAA